MSRPKRRLDSYGRTVPELRPAEQQDLRHHATNQDVQQALREVLDEIYERALRRGWYGEFSVRVHVQDGIMQPTVVESVTRHRR